MVGCRPLAERTISVPWRNVPGVTPALDTASFRFAVCPLASSPAAGVTVNHDSPVAVYGVGEPRFVSVTVRVRLDPDGITTVTSAPDALTRPVTSAVSIRVTVTGAIVT